MLSQTFPHLQSWGIHGNTLYYGGIAPFFRTSLQLDKRGRQVFFGCKVASFFPGTGRCVFFVRPTESWLWSCTPTRTVRPEPTRFGSRRGEETGWPTVETLRWWVGVPKNGTDTTIKTIHLKDSMGFYGNFMVMIWDLGDIPYGKLTVCSGSHLPI